MGVIFKNRTLAPKKIIFVIEISFLFKIPIVMKKFTYSLVLIAFATMGIAQQNMILTFTGVNNTSYVQLDSVRIMNRILDYDTVLHWPDTVLKGIIVGIHETEKAESRLQVFQNHPNPVAYETDILVYLPEKDEVSILVADIVGKTLITQTRFLEKGSHKFHFTTGGSRMYLFTAKGRFGKGSIKILSAGTTKNQIPILTYSEKTNTQNSKVKSAKIWRDFMFMPGIELFMAGYYDTLESGIVECPQTSQEYVFQFAHNIPCPEIPVVDYGGQVYNTVQIFNQCWFKENLNIGTMIPGIDDMQNNSTIEKYCYDDDEANCETYGGLYQWSEMMQYTTQQGTQGICPDGWHIPSDAEWKILEGTVDSQYQVGDPEWDKAGDRGLDAGLNLKSTSGWYAIRNGTDLYSFGALPGGLRYYYGSTYYLGYNGNWWSSSEYDASNAWNRYLGYYDVYSIRMPGYKPDGLSVRCLKD